jgi:hypothetical protein
MKLAYLFLFLALYATGLHSQTTYNKAHQTYNDYGDNMIAVDDNYYYTTNILSVDLWDDFYVSSFDAAGYIRFSTLISKKESTTATRLIQTLDKKIVLIGYANGCDYLDPNAKTFLIKMDENGYILFDNSFTYLNAGYLDHLRDLVQYSDSSYFAVTDSVLFHFSKNGVLISKKRTGFSKLTAMNLRPDGKLLLTQGFSGTQSKLIVMDTSTALISQYTLTALTARTFIKNNHTTYTFNSSAIYKRDAAMQVMASSQPVQSGGTFVNYTLVNDTIYACGQNTVNSTSFVMLMDTSLNVLSFISDTTRNVRPVSIVPKGSGIALLSNCKSAPAGNGIIGFSSFPKSSDYHFKEDIGVVGIQLDSAYASFYYSTQQNSYASNYHYYRFKFMVKNFSDHPVSSFQVNSLLNTGFVCGTLYYSQPFNNVSIAPGATYTCTSGWIERYAGSPSGSLGTVMSLGGSLCFNTSRPNEANDAAILNDAFCTSFTFTTVVTGMGELQQETTLNLFPNPTSEALKVQCSTAMQKISVLDVSGRVLYTTEITEPHEHELNVRALSSGIYFIHIETDKGPAIRKFVKQ